MRDFFSKHHEFIANVAVLISGRTTAALIALFTTPIVARLFSPGDFGVAAIFAAIVGIAANAASLRYEAAIALPPEEAEAKALMALAYRVMFVVCLILLLVIGAYEVAGRELPAVESLGPWKWFLPIGVLLLGGLHIQESWLTRLRSFKVASASLVVGNSVTSVTRIVLGTLFGSTVHGLVIGFLLGKASHAAAQRTASIEGLRAAFRPMGWQAIREIAHRYADFPKFNAPAGLIFAIGQNLPVLLFGTMFSPAIAGLYEMANRLSQVPTTIVAASMRRAFLQKAAAIHSAGRGILKAFLLSTAGLTLLGVVPFGCVWLFGQELLLLLLGDRWLVAGQYVEIMAPWLLSVWIAAPCSAVFIVLRQQRFFLIRQSALTVLRLCAFGGAFVVGADPIWTLHAFVGVTVIANLLTIVSAIALILRHQGEAAG